MPTVLKVAGFRFFFFSNEGLEPPHIHVESGDGYAKFWIRPVVLADSAGYTAKELTRLRGLVVQYAGLFEEKWNEFFSPR